MSDYADGAETMRKAILERLAELEDHWRQLRDTYDPREQYDDRMIATQEIEGYKTAAGIVRGIILEDRRSMVTLTPRQAHGLADWMRAHGAVDSDSLAPALTVLILDNMADSAERGDVSRYMGPPPLNPAIDLGLPYGDPPEPAVYIPAGEDASGNRHGKDCRWISASVYSCICGLDERRETRELLIEARSHVQRIKLLGGHHEPCQCELCESVTASLVAWFRRSNE